MTSLIVLMTTCSDEGAATSIVRQLVQERLVACGTMLPKAKSIYFWRETIEESNEVLVILKSTQTLQSACMKRLKELHPYEVPEIVALEAVGVEEAYGAWLGDVLK